MTDNNLVSQIDEFLDKIADKDETTGETKTAAADTKKPSVDAEKPSVDIEKPSADTEKPSTEELSELDALKVQNQLLQQRLNEAYTKIQPEPAKTEVTLPVDDFLMGQKFDDIIESQETFQNFLKQFMTKTVEVTREHILRDLPKTVNALTSQQLETRKAVDSFYEAHPQLAAVKPYVAQVVTTVAAEHADWDLNKVLEESAKRTYDALGLKRLVAKAERTSPAFAPTKGSKREVGSSDSALSKLEQEIAELL